VASDSTHFASEAAPATARAGKVRPARFFAGTNALPASLDHTLLCHDATQNAHAFAIHAGVAWCDDGGLALSFQVIDKAGSLLLPTPQTPALTDGLWQHTCCEAFVADEDGEGYHEFNFSPSCQWAAYRFAGYRQRDTDFQPAAAPGIALQRLSDGFRLNAWLPPALLPSTRTLHLGLTAVLETSDGSKSYWALQHCAQQPDFHLRQSFTLALTRNTP
jgi:hypothetical protein